MRTKPVLLWTVTDPCTTLPHRLNAEAAVADIPPFSVELVMETAAPGWMVNLPSMVAPWMHHDPGPRARWPLCLPLIVVVQPTVWTSDPELPMKFESPP